MKQIKHTIAILLLVLSAVTNSSYAQKMTIDNLTVEIIENKRMDLKLGASTMSGYSGTFAIKKGKKVVGNYYFHVPIINDTITHIAVSGNTGIETPRLYYDAINKKFTYNPDNQSIKQSELAFSTKDDDDIIMSGLLIWARLKHG